MTESESVALPLGDTPIFKLLRYFSRLLRFYQAFLCRFNKIFLSDRRNRVKLRRRNARQHALIAFAAKSLLVPLRQKHPYAPRPFATKTPIRAARSCKMIARGTFKSAAPLQKRRSCARLGRAQKTFAAKAPREKAFARDESGARPLRPTKALRRSFRR